MLTQESSALIENLEEYSPLLKRIFQRRGIVSKFELSKELSCLLPYESMLNINLASQRLALAVENNQRILIIGDFDADGATSTALAVRVLRDFGVYHVDFLVPNRFEYGYGLTPEIVEVAKQKQPHLIVTVDNGISSHAGVERANQLGIDVIITDHHLPGLMLPKAYTIVNPNQAEDQFSSKNLAGVGVIFYVMVALRNELNNRDWFLKNKLQHPNLAKYLDLVALGTIADLVKLDQNNRILVHQGLERIRKGATCPGILALLETAKRSPFKLSASELGFIIAPRLNAAGRLDDMSLGINCLLSNDSTTALTIAQELNRLNLERRSIEHQMQEEALTLVSHLDLKNQEQLGVCLFDETWHQGIIGLVASKIKDKIYRPTIAFAKAEESYLKGSARSIPGIHIRDILAIIDSKHPNLIDRFGGHAMAAGLSLAAKNYKFFNEILNLTLHQHSDLKLFTPKVETDGQLTCEELTLQTAELLKEQGPWGQGFSEPLFEGVFQVIHQKIVGEKYLKLKLKQDGYIISAIVFNINQNQLDQTYKKIHCIYRLEINEYKGQKNLELIIESIVEVLNE